MTGPIHLSAGAVPAEAGIRREPPRPPHLRNSAYASQFDWDTLFYDVYRVGRHIVFQGPPLLNLGPALRRCRLFAGRFGLFGQAVHVGRDKRGEIWLRDDADRVTIEAPLGRFDLAVQPNLSHLFAGKRVLHTLSKDNPSRWIADWIRFYARIHGADAVLIYDNGSTLYSAPDLEAELRATFPEIVIHVVSWPFRYGPQGGLAGAVENVETPWDSDFCQTGSLQHARFRFLLEAKSVLNVDIDELVLSNHGRSIFAATETSPTGFIKFPGAWISTASPVPVAAETCRHADFVLRDRRETETCPPKWCIVPGLRHAHRHSWSVHNLFGSPHNRTVSTEFEYRHMKGISNSWKYDRWDESAFDRRRFAIDQPLANAFAQAGMIGQPALATA